MSKHPRFYDMTGDMDQAVLDRIARQPRKPSLEKQVEELKGMVAAQTAMIQALILNNAGAKQ